MTYPIATALLVSALIGLVGCGGPKGPPPPPTEAEAQRFVDEMIAALANRDQTWMERHARPWYYRGDAGPAYVEAINESARQGFTEYNAECSRTLERFTVDANRGPGEPAVIFVTSRLACGDRTHDEELRVEWLRGMMGDLQPNIAEVRRSKPR